MKVLALLTALLLTLSPSGSAWGQSETASPAKPNLSQNLRTSLPQGTSNIQLAPLHLLPVRERLLTPQPQRTDSFGNSRVDLAPKVWPYPMVVSPGRPVLPGSAW